MVKVNLNFRRLPKEAPQSYDQDWSLQRRYAD